MFTPKNLFDLSQFSHAAIFDNCEFAWEALVKIRTYIEQQFAGPLKPSINSPVGNGAYLEGDIYIGHGTLVEPGALIYGPTIIGNNCQIRQGAYVRGDVILGDNAIVGHASEVKNSILLNGAQASHFAYVGDSIMGNRVNLGAGTKFANVPLFSTPDPITHQRPTVKLKIDDLTINTGLSKLGAIVADDVQIGCNTVTNPGCVIGPRTLVYALSSLASGYHPADSIIKLRQEQQIVEIRT